MYLRKPISTNILLLGNICGFSGWEIICVFSGWEIIYAFSGWEIICVLTWWEIFCVFFFFFCVFS